MVPIEMKDLCHQQSGLGLGFRVIELGPADCEEGLAC